MGNKINLLLILLYGALLAGCNKKAMLEEVGPVPTQEDTQPATAIEAGPSAINVNDKFDNDKPKNPPSAKDQNPEPEDPEVKQPEDWMASWINWAHDHKNSWMASLINWAHDHKNSWIAWMKEFNRDFIRLWQQEELIEILEQLQQLVDLKLSEAINNNSDIGIIWEELKNPAELPAIASMSIDEKKIREELRKKLKEIETKISSDNVNEEIVKNIYKELDAVVSEPLKNTSINKDQKKLLRDKVVVAILIDALSKDCDDQQIARIQYIVYTLLKERIGDQL